MFLQVVKEIVKSYQKQDEVKGLSQYPWKTVHLLWIYPIISYTFPVHKM